MPATRVSFWQCKVVAYHVLCGALWHINTKQNKFYTCRAREWTLLRIDAFCVCAVHELNDIIQVSLVKRRKAD